MTYDELMQMDLERIFIGGDLNGHVSIVIKAFRNIHDGYGFEVINKESRTILDCPLTYDIVITNTFFKKRNVHIITYRNESNKIQIDYFLMRKKDYLQYKYSKVDY